MSEDLFIVRRRTRRKIIGDYLERFGFLLIPVGSGYLLGLLTAALAFLLFWS